MIWPDLRGDAKNQAETAWWVGTMLTPSHVAQTCAALG